MSFPRPGKFSRHAKSKVPMLKKLREDIRDGGLEKLINYMQNLKVEPLKSGKMKLLILAPSEDMVRDLLAEGWNEVDRPYPSVYQFER